MYINPNTNIRILRNVPLDTTYDHTIYFEDQNKQYNYFIALQKYNLQNYSYQRVKKGVTRVGINSDKLYDCNYMMFQNTAFGNKWFYAFIKDVEYINNECSDIYYEIDVLQTWFFDYKIDQCFVEREHSITDEIGENIENEPINCGEYVFNDYSPLFSLNDLCVCIAIVDTNKKTDGTLYDGIYGSAELWVYDNNSVQEINGKINEYVQKPDAIISIYMFPKILINEIPSGNKLPFSSSSIINTILVNAISTNDKLNGYKPKNNKLYTYPYNFYHVDNASGSELSLRYEFFENNTPVFELNGTITQPISVILRPCSYKGVSNYSELGGYTTLNTETLQLNNFPICSWNVDSYQAWLAQNSIPNIVNTASLLGGNLETSGVTNLSQIGGILNQYYKASISADISKGSFNNGGANVVSGKQQFYGGRCSVTAQKARIIDDYFNMFGYATNRVKKPNINSRPHWNYVKTIGVTITGSIPCDDMKKICQIYDNGITFWKNGEEIGNYSLNNKP